MTTGMPFESKITSLMYGQSPKKFADFVFSSDCLLINLHAYLKQEKIKNTCTIKLDRNQG